MYPNTLGSESSTNLCSGSGTNDPTPESSQAWDASAVSEDLFSHHGTESQNTEAGNNASTKKREVQSKGLPMDLKNCAAGHKNHEVSNPDNKRKRTEDDAGEPRICAAPSPRHVGFSFPGKDITRRSRSVSETCTEEPSDYGLTTDRTGFSIYGHLVGESSKNGPVLISSPNEQIWRRVFCFVPPVFLGRLLRVNRLFHSLLSPDIPRMPVYPLEETGSAVFPSTEAIWAASRRRFCPGLPKPLRGLHELQMWRLLRGSDCQLCGEKSNLLTSSATSNPWKAGPGSNGVRIIWPFGTRCCGKCLRIHTEKEVTLLFSSTFPSFLLQALPFAFVSQSEHFVTSMALKNAIPPADVHLTKYYLKFHAEEIKRQLQSAKELGSGSAEEWIKGLENEGQEKCNDAARWEQWEVKGGLKKVNIRPNSKPGPSMARQTLALATSTKASPRSGNGDNRQTTDEIPAAPFCGLSTVSESTSRASLPSSPYMSSTAHSGLPQRPQMLTPQVRPERNIRDVNEAKLVRRAEIERRCLSLDPPLEANVLFHMESFQASLQISTVLTDNAWEILKPRLLAQRESAELRERERIQQSKLLQVKSEERKHQEAQLKETKELLDKEWDTIQAPIRERLGVFADEIIKASWKGGNSVTKDNCPKFAADVLLYARQKFYDDVVQKDKARRAGENVRPDPPNDPPARKLILENMKWLFDNKVKNFTEQFQKDLFLCNGCEGNFKFYGFEGVIQHYAAKHTTSLSLGSVVVHWRAEWPENPPFNPDPRIAQVPYYSASLPISSLAQNQYSGPPQPIVTFSDYAQMAAPSVQPPQEHGSQYSPSSYQIQYPVQLQSGHYQLLSTTPNGYSQTSIHNGISQPDSKYHTPRPENPAVVAHGFQSFSENSTTRLQPSHPRNSLNPYHPVAQQVANPGGYLPRHPGGPYPGSLPAVSSVKPVPTYSTRIASIHELKTMSGADLYSAQMNEMAHQAHSVWVGTSGIKDFPQSVRIFIVIHHTVFCFMQKYAIEPSLAMFIDCLNHDPLLRPVRSLNGLACKTCVTLGTGTGDDYHTHPRLIATDRKLYTLPHLLDHFTTVHLERVLSAINLLSGLEPSGPDWKRDMIELPAMPLIVNLVNARGIDGSKFQLIAAAFPNIFPDSLPIKEYVEHRDPNSTHGIDYSGATVQQYERSYVQEITPTPPDQAHIQSQYETATPLQPESLLQTSSCTSTRASEPPGDDEYDPNRPAYYGKIVDSRQFPSRNTIYDSSSIEVVRLQPTAIPRPEIIYDKVHSKDFQPEPSLEKRPRSDDDQAERIEGHEALHFNAATSGMMGHNGSVIKLWKSQSPNFGDSSQYVSDDGELVEEPIAVHQNGISGSDIAGVTAAERFLNEFNPGVRQKGHQADANQRDRGTKSRPMSQKIVETPAQQLDSVIRVNEIVPVKRTETDTQYSMRSTPSFMRRLEPGISDGLQYPYFPTDHRQSFDPLSQSIPHAHRRYTEDLYPAGGISTRAYEARTISYAGHISSGIDERNKSVPRSARNQNQLSHTAIRRSRSRSPVQVACTSEQSPSQSPYWRSPYAPVYHVEPPIPLNDGPFQRIIQHAYPTDQNNDARPRMAGYPGEHYGQRIKYIPVREDIRAYPDRGRYIIAQPVEQMRSTDQMRTERNYVGNEVFETDGHIYYSARRQANARPVRATNSAYVKYRADLG